jgi:hypothetical protein
MTTTSNKRQSLTLFTHLVGSRKKGGSITVEWSAPESDGNYIPVSLVDTVHITSPTGNRSTYEFDPGDTRVTMLLDACDVAWTKGHDYALDPFASKA